MRAYDHRQMAIEIEKERPLFDRALKLRDEGRVEEAIVILKGFTERYPKLATPHGVLGGTYYQEGEYDKAIHYLSVAARLSPHSELASRVLFHSLLKTGRTAEAKEELERYIELTGSEEFSRMLQQLVTNEESSR